MKQVTTRQTIYFKNASDLWRYCVSLQEKVYNISGRSMAITLECSEEEVKKAITDFNAITKDKLRA